MILFKLECKDKGKKPTQQEKSYNKEGLFMKVKPLR